VRHGVPCSLAGGPIVVREDSKKPRTVSISTSSSASISRTSSRDGSFILPSNHHLGDGLDIASLSDYAGLSPSHLSDAPSPMSFSNTLSNWQQDLQLMHHYTTQTRFVLAESHVPDYVLATWQSETPKVAFAHDYVMHGLLCLTALHKAHLEPIRATSLHVCATNHLNVALAVRQAESPLITFESAKAKFVFAWLLPLFAYAMPVGVSPIDSTADVFLLVSGMDTLLPELWDCVAQGPLAPVVSTASGGPIVFPPDRDREPFINGIAFGLGQLDDMLAYTPMTADEQQVCSMILADLKIMYEDLARPDDAYSSMVSILCFPKQCTATFVSLLRKRTPCALVLLAYFCVVLDIFSDRWWMHDRPQLVLRDILGSLDDSWRHWVEQPVQALLCKDQTSVRPSDLML